MYVCMFVCMPVCLSVCLYVCMYVRMYVCMCGCMYSCFTGGVRVNGHFSLIYHAQGKDSPTLIYILSLSSTYPCGASHILRLRSRDGLTFSNLTIGAFGPTIRFQNGTYWNNAYIERPFVLQDDSNVPIAFYGGLGRTSYSDSCSWAQYFCKKGTSGCGPTLPPPPPPPVHLVNNGKCLISNSTFPCSGSGGRASCPVFMGDCKSPMASWVIRNDDTIFSTHFAGMALNVDCNACRTHTLVKLLASSPSSITFNKTSRQLEFASCPSLCLNAGQGDPEPPCGPAGEEYLATQIKLAPCISNVTQGWSLVPV